MLCGKPGNGVSGDVVVFERSIELCDEVGESSKGKQCSRDGALVEGRGPGEGQSFSHIRESEGNLFIVGIIDRLVHEEIKLHHMQPMLGFVVRAVKRFGNANM